MESFRADPAGKVFYIGVPDVSKTLDHVIEQGGEVDKSRFKVPGVVIPGLFRDPAGNRIGLVDMANGEVKVP